MAASSSNISFPDSNNKNPRRKPIMVGETMFLAIAKPIVEQLHIDEEYTWLEQIPTSDGIYFKIVKEDMDRSQRSMIHQ
jgi:hypothetical protein